MKTCASKRKYTQADGGKPLRRFVPASRSAARAGLREPLAWFGDMISHCLDYAQSAKASGRAIVPIMCEFTPRELIMAAGAVPVCLCGGSVDTIPAAEKELPSTLCPLIKSTYGYSVEASNPFLEMADLVVAETTCDGKKKMFELMGRRHPMCLLELPQKEGDPEGLRHWLSQLRMLRRTLESALGVKITDERIRAAARRMNAERSLRRRLALLMKADPAPFTGRQLIDFRSSVSCIPEDLRMFRQALRAASPQTGRRRASRAIRVLMTGVPMVSGVERVLELIEDAGATVVCMENCTGLKPILEDVDVAAPDVMMALAVKYFHLPCSVMTPNSRRLESLRDLSRCYGVDCVIELVWQGCITYAVEAGIVADFVKGELGLPYLRVETDYAPSDSARISNRIEALLETVAAKSNRPGRQGRR